MEIYGREYFVSPKFFKDFFNLFIHHNIFCEPAEKFYDGSLGLDVFTLRPRLGYGRGRLLVGGPLLFGRLWGGLPISPAGGWEAGAQGLHCSGRGAGIQSSWACLTETVDPHKPPARPLLHFIHLVLQGIDGRLMVGYNVNPLELLLEQMDSPCSYGVPNLVATRL